MRVSLVAVACAGAGEAGSSVLAAIAAKPVIAPRRDGQQLPVNADRRLALLFLGMTVLGMTVLLARRYV
jgi:hypothetical protein